MCRLALVLVLEDRQRVRLDSETRWFAGRFGLLVAWNSPIPLCHPRSLLEHAIRCTDPALDDKHSAGRLHSSRSETPTCEPVGCNHWWMMCLGTVVEVDRGLIIILLWSWRPPWWRNRKCYWWNSVHSRWHGPTARPCLLEGRSRMPPWFIPWGTHVAAFQWTEQLVVGNRYNLQPHPNRKQEWPWDLWLFSTAWYGTVRFSTVHFFWGGGGGFHWVQYLVSGTFLVPPRPRFQAIRTVPKTWRVNSTDHWLARENHHYCVTELATRDPA